MENQATKQTIFKFTPEQHMKIRKYSREEGISMKELVLRALDFYEKNVINK